MMEVRVDQCVCHVHVRLSRQVRPTTAADSTSIGLFLGTLIARTQRADAGVWSRITTRLTIGNSLSSS